MHGGTRTRTTVYNISVWSTNSCPSTLCFCSFDLLTTTNKKTRCIYHALQKLNVFNLKSCNIFLFLIKYTGKIYQQVCMQEGPHNICHYV